MRIVRSVKAMQHLSEAVRGRGRRVGFVPTMGALHEGHVSLLRRCRRENDLTVLSIFVNPKQFGPAEDFKRYPRPEKSDKMLAKQEKVDIIFYPSEKTMYPTGFLTSIQVRGLAGSLCGKSRPGHFEGVATVVGKLLNIVRPDVLYLGQKDAQQAVILRKMVQDLNFPVRVKICPTVRERDGLALSSRNRYLTPKERREAPVLYRSLREARRRIKAGERSAGRILGRIRSRIEKETGGRIDYVECVDADSLKALKVIQGKALIALAVRFGTARLIDNIIVRV